MSKFPWNFPRQIGGNLIFWAIAKRGTILLARLIIMEQYWAAHLEPNWRLTMDLSSSTVARARLLSQPPKVEEPQLRLPNLKVLDILARDNGA